MGYLDAEGVWIYTEDQGAAPVSALLNSLALSTSAQITAVRAEMRNPPPATAITPATGWQVAAGQLAPNVVTSRGMGFLTSGMIQRNTSGVTLVAGSAYTVATIPAAVLAYLPTAQVDGGAIAFGGDSIPVPMQVGITPAGAVLVVPYANVTFNAVPALTNSIRFMTVTWVMP